LRRLEPLIRQEARRVPFEMNIHNNTFLRSIWEEGKEAGRQEARKEAVRELLLEVLGSGLEQKFGPLPSWARERLDQADAATLETWISRAVSSQSLPDVFE
jgi:hypothetical protein